MNFINLKYRPVSKIQEICQIQKTSFQYVTKKKTLNIVIKCSYINSSKKNNSLDNTHLLSQNDSTKT